MKYLFNWVVNTILQDLDFKFGIMVNKLIVVFLFCTFSSYGKRRMNDCHFINIKSDSDFIFTKAFVELKTQPFFLNGKNKVGLQFIDSTGHIKVNNETTTGMMHKILRMLNSTGDSLSPNCQLSIFLIGDIFLKRDITTRLLCVYIDDNVDRHRIVIGVNILNGRVKSIIEFAESFIVVGSGSSTYTKLFKRKFKIIHPFTTCLTGFKNRTSYDHCIIKMQANGILYGPSCSSVQL